MTQWKQLLNPELLGVSIVMRRLRQNVASLADLNEPVLIYSEPGLEALSVAYQLLQQRSKPTDSLLVLDADTLNKNAKTLEKWVGPLKQDSLLVLVVNNVHELKPKSQQLLLQFIQNPSLNKANSDFQHQLRVITVAKPGLASKIADGSFSSELFDLLSGYSLRVPPLNERLEDVPVLFQDYVQAHCDGKKTPIPQITFETISDLLAHEWQDDLSGVQQMAADMIDGYHTGIVKPLVPQTVQQAVSGDIVKLPVVLADLERELLQRALTQAKGRQRDAARVLGISEPLLRYKMKKYDLYERFMTRRGRPVKA